MDSMRVRVYKYGLRAPVVGAPLVREQLWLAHRYRNELVAIERQARQDVRAAQSAHPDVAPLSIRAAELHEQCEALYRERAAQQDAGEKRRLGAALKAHKALLKEARDDLREAKRRLRDDVEVSGRVAAIYERAHGAYIAMRAHYSRTLGLRHGTYTLVEQAHEAARKAPTDPEFVRWTGHGHYLEMDEAAARPRVLDTPGCLGLQVQRGMQVSCEDLSAADQKWLRLVPRQDDRPPSRRRRHGTDQYDLWMRVGTDETPGAGRPPVWAIWPLKYHRPIPPGAVIKTVKVRCDLEGTREVWTVSFTVHEPCAVRRTGASVISIDIGWRRMPGHLRAARWVDGEGRRGEVTVSDRVPSGLEKADSLRSIADSAFNASRDALRAWLLEAECVARGAVPAWLIEETSHLHAWKSRRRMIRLYHRWTRSRFAGDAAGYAVVQSFWLTEYHLVDWEQAQRRRSANRRDNDFSVFAAWAARTYEHVIIEGPMDLRQFATRKTPGEAPRAARARKNRVVTAPSHLLGAIARACDTHGATLHEITPVNSTRECAACGAVNLWDAAAQLRHTCDGCGAEWDQDDNAADNLLGRWRERGGPTLPGREQKQAGSGRWKKRKEDRSQTAAQGAEISGD